MSNFYNQASWVLVPSGIEEDIVFAQKPISGLGDLTFTRASDATYTDSSGVVRRSPYNLFQQSEMFSNAIWSKSASTIGIDATLAPNGTLTADKLQEDSSNGTHLINQPVTNSNSVFSFSIYAKKSERDFLYLQAFGVLPNNFTYAPSAYFNLNTGVVSSVSNATATIESVGNGWYRCTLNCTSIFPQTSASVGFYIMTATANGVNSYAGTTGSGIFIWGAQVSTSTSALDYFPTTNRQDVPRIDFRNADGTLSSCGRLLLEPQRTNSIRNSSMVGAVAGSPGTLPTNYTASLVGLTQTIVGTGTENGLQYIDYRLSGTATGNAELRLEGNTIAASTGQAWTMSTYFKAISGAPNSTRLVIIERTAIGTYIVDGSTGALAVDSTLKRFTFTRTLSGGVTVALVQPVIFFFMTAGQTYDFTIRIAAPQMELGAFATTWVPTTTAAVTRLADSYTRGNVFTNGLVTSAGGTWIVDLSNNLQLTRDGATSFSIGDNVIGTLGNSFNIRQNGGSSRFAINKTIGGSATVLYTTLTDNVKIAIKWNGSTADVFVNGTKVVSATSFTSTALQFMAATGGDNPKYINQMLLAPTPLSDAECIQLTTL